MSYLRTPVDPNFNADMFPDEKDNKKWKERNDRQLRLWGIHGQARIDDAHVCLLNATAVGAEVLKNIVLPGFGRFTIIDNKLVTPRDFGSNFFVNKEGLGKSRAKVVRDLVAELNPDCVGSYMEHDPVQIVEKNPEIFDRFNFIVASNVDFKTLRKLSKICYDKNKVLVIVRSYGMVGYVRVLSKSHEIIEGKPDNPVEDLRLTHPWKELIEYCESQDLSTMDFETHKHTPYVVILLNLMKKWKQSHGGQLPKTRKEKDDFVAFLKNSAQKFQEEDNFQQAVSKVYHIWTEPEIPDEVQRILKDPRADPKNLTKDSSDFWFMAYGLREFVANEGKGQLPIMGVIPDMESDSERYIKLQNIYKLKSRADMSIVKKYVVKQLKNVGKAEDSISDMDIKEFCKNSHYLRVIDYRNLEQELDPKTANVELIESELTCNPDSNILWYLLLLAVDRFREKEGYYPGEDLKKDIDPDVKKLSQYLDSVFKDYKISVKDSIQNLNAYVTEMVRFGNSEIHNISSLVGGVGAQELIKLCTHQRLPLNNTWIYNGITSVSEKWEL